MTDQVANQGAVADGDVEVETGPKKRGLSGKKLVLFIVLPVVLLLVTGAGLYFSGLLDSLLGRGHIGDAMEEELKPLPTALYYDLPDMLVNLNTGERGQAFLRLTVSLELVSSDAWGILDQVQPRVIDSFQVYLRELRVEDLSGSAGIQRLREELLLRVNAAAQSHVVKDLLFKEMLVQ